MKASLFSILFFFLSSVICLAQSNKEQQVGKVTFLTSGNVYVSFDNTDEIIIGDTLRLMEGTNLNPCLKVTNKSSRSCVCVVINACDIEVGDQVAFLFGGDKKVIQLPDNEKEAKGIQKDKGNSNASKTNSTGINKENIRGYVSAASYNDLSSLRDNNHRMMYRFSLNAANIKNSKFSLESYMNLQEFFRKDESSGLQHSLRFKVYNLAVKYDVNPSLWILLGRHINRKASSLGALDGLQAEKFFGNFYTGAIIGFRPDIYNYGFNKDLFEYGVYIGVKTDNQNYNSQTTIGFLEQRNSGNVDRRYIFFQYSASALRKLNLYSSGELDLYSKINGESKSDARLTNIYLSARYRINNKVNLSVSYDARKRIIHYETYQSIIEQLIENDESRQGLRFRVNVRPIKYLSTGLSYSKRFQHSGANKSDNFNAFVSWTKIPGIGGRLYVYFNLNNSSYLRTIGPTIRYTQSFYDGKLIASLYYRYVDYNYRTSELAAKQHYYGTNLSYSPGKKILISLNGEMAARTEENNYRVNLSVTKRFAKK